MISNFESPNIEKRLIFILKSPKEQQRIFFISKCFILTRKKSPYFKITQSRTKDNSYFVEVEASLLLFQITHFTKKNSFISNPFSRPRKTISKFESPSIEHKIIFILNRFSRYGHKVLLLQITQETTENIFFYFKSFQSKEKQILLISKSPSVEQIIFLISSKRKQSCFISNHPF